MGSDDELFEAFCDAWGHLWDRHKDVSHERWTAIHSFARQHVPRLCVDWAPINPIILEYAIARKKSTTTAGLDGVTLYDLKHMPPAALSNFADLFRHAEATGEWPTQMLAGHVTCLGKTEAPQNALDFRPYHRSGSPLSMLGYV